MKKPKKRIRHMNYEMFNQNNNGKKTRKYSLLLSFILLIFFFLSYLVILFDIKILQFCFHFIFDFFLLLFYSFYFNFFTYISPLNIYFIALWYFIVLSFDFLFFILHLILLFFFFLFFFLFFHRRWWRDQKIWKSKLQWWIQWKFRK